MKYSCKYKSKPSFPYNKDSVSTKEATNSSNTDVSSVSDFNFLSSLLYPIENLIGRKIEFEDILLIGIRL